MNFEERKMCPRFKSLPKATKDCNNQRQTVCRNLFGPVNHRMTEKFLSKELDQILVTCKKDWDFDFSRGAPLLGGRFSWEPSLRFKIQGGNKVERESPFKKANCEAAGLPLGRTSSRCAALVPDVQQKVAGSRNSRPRKGEEVVSRPLCRKKSRTKMVTFKTDTAVISSAKSLIQSTIKDYLPIRKLPLKWKESSGLERVKESSGLERVKESSRLERVKESSGLERVTICRPKRCQRKRVLKRSGCELRSARAKRNFQ